MIEHDRPHWLLPAAQNFVIKDTATAGRAVFAKTGALAGLNLLKTSPDQSPIAHVILRPYRREVCAWCFLYDRGREWKIRDLAAGVTFCSASCEEFWVADNDETCREACRSVESFIKGQAKRRNQAPFEEQPSNVVLGEGSAGFDSVRRTWKQAEEHGTAIARVRTESKPSKTQRAILSHAKELAPDPDILTYVLSGVLAAYKAWLSLDGAEDRTRSTDAHVLLPSLFELVPDDRVFTDNPMTQSPLHDYTSAHSVLLAILPATILSVITPDLVINLASRAAHNAFSIRPEGMTDGDQSGEFLGWGVWPEASFFNHSCSPNVKKERIGRLWSFAVDVGADKIVQQGQQLCITYLGGDEKDLDVTERRKRLQEQWGFRCLCERCLGESGET
ncbi:Histone-lysine N-methyltransferase set-6 [Knufia obscura]|uniref:Histone-lysine N-methyltransferase set-6 n=2 Tax=Knufia TaxID=430999 RepID=A0AAN8FFH3_9EURO|nr:Histone-lysine N-methyltransferase set-6 [Knufia obscura]KAK5957566.1 Histone-lysine N-methyltransferase set-6 [Knufia fluminis]